MSQRKYIHIKDLKKVLKKKKNANDFEFELKMYNDYMKEIKHEIDTKYFFYKSF